MSKKEHEASANEPVKLLWAPFEPNPKVAKMAVDATKEVFRQAKPRRVRSEQVPEPVARWVLDHCELVRVSGDVVCESCGEAYYGHHEVMPTFHLLCDGRLGKT